MSKQISKASGESSKASLNTSVNSKENVNGSEIGDHIVTSQNSGSDLENELKEKDSQLNQLMTKNWEMSSKLNILERDLQLRTEERENFKNRIQNLESELAELRNRQPNTLNASQQAEVNKIKKASEEMITKAKGIIFDKTKICKNQELQIEALTQQVTSLKEVLAITKDLLEIRNMEVKHLNEKMECMDAKISAEKHRHDLMHKKMDAMVQMNSDLKSEYECQLKLFDALRVSYSTKGSLEGLQKEHQS